MNYDRTLLLNEILSPNRLTRLVDIGANPIAATPYAKLKKLELCEVWGFEPQQQAFDQLISNAGKNERYLPYAIGKGGKQNLHICQGSGFSSLYEPNPDFINTMGRWPKHMRVEQVLPVSTHRLDDIEELPEFDLLKIDVQGSELDVFSAATQKLQNAIAVITEVAMVPLYKGQPLLDAQMRELASQEFHFHKFLFLKSLKLKSRTSWRLKSRALQNQAIDGDAVFLKFLFSLADMPIEKLKHLAILADSVFDSPDVAILALDLLVDHGTIQTSDLSAYLSVLDSETEI